MRLSSPPVALHLGIDPRSQRLTGQTGEQIVGADFRHRVARADRGAGDVRGDDDVRQLQQRIVPRPAAPGRSRPARRRRSCPLRRASARAL